MSAITVAYATDRAMAMPMRVSAASLLRHLVPGVLLDLHIIHDGLTHGDLGRLCVALSATGRRYRLSLHPFEAGRYEGLPRFHGSMLTYASIHLPDVVGTDRVLYLDSDTVVLSDITPLCAADLQGAALGAVSWGMTLRDSIDRALLTGLGYDEAMPVLNGGVLVYDRAAYHAAGVAERAMAFARQHGEAMRAADQTMLNAALRGDFCLLPWQWNVRLGRNEPPYAGPGIAHFVGRVKPWTLAGLRHPNRPLWVQAARDARMGNMPMGLHQA